MFHVATGRSSHSNAFQAGREAAHSAQAEVAHRNGRQVRPGLALVFGDDRYAQQRVLDGVADIIGRDVTLVGCSSNGQISPLGLEQGAVVVMLIWPGSRLAVCPVLTTGVGANPYASGLALGRQVRAHLPHAADVTTRTKWIGDRFVTIHPYTLLLFSDSAGSDHALLAGASAALGPAFQIVGGMAASALCMGEPCVYYNGSVQYDAAVGLAIVSRVPTSVGICHGCSAEHAGTMTHRNDCSVHGGVGGRVTLTLSPHPFILQSSTTRSSHPASSSGRNDHIQRHVFQVPGQGTRVIDGNGSVPHSGLASLDGCTDHCNVEAARTAAAYARNSLGNALPAAAMIFSSSRHADRSTASMGRKLEAVRSILGESVPVIGFHANGAPATADLHAPDPHNQTCVVYVVGI